MPAETADRGTILLTGATGFLGGQLLTRLLDRTDRRVVALTRRPLAIKHPRLTTLHADLTAGPLPDLPSEITTVIHCAASVAFDLPLDEQRAINVGGTARVLDAARALPHLERFMHVSTAYVAGTHDGPFGPDDLDRGQGFRNAYEQSKLEGEQLVRASGLPFQVVRPSIVVGDQRTGHTDAFNVVYMPLRAYARGQMQIARGRTDAPVDVIPIDVVADGMLALLGEPVGGTHLLVAGPKATTVAEFIQLAADRFDRPPAAVMDHDTLLALIDGLPEREQAAARDALDRAEALLPYFDVRCEFDDPATTAILARAGVHTPRLPEYFDRLMDYAEATRWGRRRAPDASSAEGQPPSSVSPARTDSTSPQEVPA